MSFIVFMLVLSLQSWNKIHSSIIFEIVKPYFPPCVYIIRILLFTYFEGFIILYIRLNSDKIFTLRLQFVSLISKIKFRTCFLHHNYGPLV